jgi:hypothetical protein
VTASLEYRLSPRWTLTAAGGSVLSGRLQAADGSFAIGPGAVVSLGASWLALEPEGLRPFALLSAGLTWSQLGGPTEYTAGDLRLGVTVGYTFFERVSPYLTARLFGGPVRWRGQMYTDRYHYQLGVGAAVGLPAGFDLLVEAVPFGEQRITGGLGLNF